MDLAAFSAAGIARVTVREPRIRVLPVRGSGIITAAARLIAADIERRGGAARLDESGRGLDVAMAAESADAIVAIGGTGSGRNDSSVQTLAREGELTVHGLALTPGETAAFGFVGVRPVLLLPGRLDSALSVWLFVGRRMLDRLAAVKNSDNEPTETFDSRTQGQLNRRLGGNRAGAAQRYGGRANGNQVSIAVVIDPVSRLDIGACRQRRIFRRNIRSGKALALSVVK